MKNRTEQQPKDYLDKSKPYQDDPNKSDLANDMNAMREHNKKKRSAKVLYFLEKVQPVLELKYNLIVKEFNTNSFRITDGIKQIDFYPASGKVFTDKKKWKSVTSNVIESINQYLI